MKTMADPARNLDDRFTYGDYKSWPDEERWELIDGRAWAMSPAPTRNHQGLASKLFTDLSTFLSGKPCKAYFAPFDVLLPEGDESDDEVATVVQPDIVVFCDKTKLTKAGARGAPDLVVEILSPSTSKKDLNEKFRVYEKHGVREYWVVDPGNRAVQVWRIRVEGGYDSGELRDLVRDDSPIASKLLEGFVVDPKGHFEEMD
jgi:Uma2 family endonuclease